MNMFPVLEKPVTKVCGSWLYPYDTLVISEMRTDHPRQELMFGLRGLLWPASCQQLCSAWPVQPDNAGLGMVSLVVYVWCVSDWLVFLLVVKDCG